MKRTIYNKYVSLICVFFQTVSYKNERRKYIININFLYTKTLSHINYEFI
jgi:hypothetical protein